MVCGWSPAIPFFLFLRNVLFWVLVMVYKIRVIATERLVGFVFFMNRSSIKAMPNNVKKQLLCLLKEESERARTKRR